MDFFDKTKTPVKMLDLIRQREINELNARNVAQKLQVTPNFVSRLGLETELEGHEGCVNCLEWNESGQILASASDDMHVILWDPFSYKKKLTLQTGHSGNIFTVKFMPKSNDTVLVTGAGDYKIRVHDISLSDIVLVCNCHFGRVKRIGTAPSIPFLFWSASEDGIIRQYDLRVPHTCKANEQSNVLVNLCSTGRFVEAKCIAVNPRKPELIAVGANDAYIRMYDRRMIKLSLGPNQSVLNNESVPSNGMNDLSNTNVPLGCAQYFIAGHLRHKDNSKRFSTTYLTFNDNGDELLVNMGGEQIYLFDINNNNRSTTFIVPAELNKKNAEIDEGCDNIKNNGINPTVLENLSPFNITELKSEIEELKDKANEAFEQERYANAITLYNEAIYLCPEAAVLYANRAGTYMKRGWDGDTYAALRDCRIALALDPNHVKAYYRLAKCLYNLNHVSEANVVFENFKEKFPEFVNNSSCKALKKSIKEALNSDRDSSGSKSGSQGQISSNEKEWRIKAKDFKYRFCGHCNTITDIKEANFFGTNGQFIVAGSDDGSFFIWDKYTTNIVHVLRGDQRIVNCLQPHPSMCLLATSGIDPVIRLWSPLPEDGTSNFYEVENSCEAATANYIRMNSDHFEVMLFNMGYRYPQNSEGSQDNEDRQESVNMQPLNCRPS